MKKPLSPVTHISLISTLIGIGLTTGCGNMMKPYTRTAPPGSYQSNLYLNSTSSSNPALDKFTCPQSANILPDYDYTMDGSGYYSVCKTNDPPTDILVHGQTSSSNTIYIFPAQFVDASHIYTKPDVQTGLPMSQRLDVSTAEGVIASFPDVNFNAVFIVEGPDKAQMENCLANWNYLLCPRYSYGRFR